ncbi:MAG: A24 family peptidase [Planctomycetaceae bacterium]
MLLFFNALLTLGRLQAATYSGHALMLNQVPRRRSTCFILSIVLGLTGSTLVASASEMQQPVEGGTSMVIHEDVELTAAQKSNQFRLEIVTYLGFLAIGACVGSFLNVVIYRLPNGRSVVGSSSCPACDTQIQWRHNIPIVGWLRLRGRCSSCEIKIPARYPAVEALIAGLFVLLLSACLVTGGGNLPIRTPNYYRGVIWVIWYPQWDLIGIYLFHCCLGCVLIAAALIQWDGHPLPVRLKRFAFGTGLTAPIFWKHLHPVGAHEPRPDWLTENWRWQVEFTGPVTGWPQNFGVGVDGLIDSVVGFAAGVVAGWLVAKCLGKNTLPAAHTKGFVALFGIVGAFLGWQAMVPVAIVVAILNVLFGGVGRVTGDRRWGTRTANAALAAAVLLYIPLWRKLSLWTWSPDHTGWPLISTTDWWPSKALEPYGSLTLALAVGCLIAATSRLVSSSEPASSDTA